ncbi:MAG: preprotein translocase subunit SecE [Syntrophomonadaceae bacterium]|mgnify:CR=1 FL=1|nr:preprotein translocase subunit SecE [Syntrophomonadaceae bacterium]
MPGVKKIDEKRLGAGRGRTATSFFRNAWAELKKVHWPTRSELLVYTAVVLVAVAFVALLIWVADSLLSLLLEQLFRAVGKG